MSNKDKPSKPPSGEDIYIFSKTFPELSWKDVGIHYGEPLKTVKNREFRYCDSPGTGQWLNDSIDTTIFSSILVETAYILWYCQEIKEIWIPNSISVRRGQSCLTWVNV